MADFNDVVSAVTGASNMINSTLSENGITNLASTARGLIVDLLTISIADMCNFNARNYAYMTYHMLRNIHERNITLSTVGENAYANGNPELPSMSPQKPSYTDGNNYYVDFMEKVHTSEAQGQLTTRATDSMSNPANRSNLFNTVNMYFDAGDGVTFDQDGHATLGPVTTNRGVDYTGNAGDVNSILYKMQKLYNQQKVNSIISDFHTKYGLTYEGQVGSQYGESHGRNLLTKDAEDGTTSSAGYSVNGYDNPYCRVWTHHYMYDRLSKTMRAKTGGINYWGEDFEWNENDSGHDEKTLKELYGEQIGENYDYAWRGKHNQERRRENSVLDFGKDGNTGLPIMSPKFGGGEDKNIHTKSCMFSIENLAWKDYDPYAFEQALSWEQRGPFGGRIMWFPPYNLRINETASAKWNPNDFIGRGESIYTYVNSERTGTLSFTMLTDHPSSLDYSTWWSGQPGDLGEGIEKLQWGVGDKETDFLRYFAGCMGDGNGGDDNTGEDNIKEKPTPMIDEYKREPMVGMKGEKEQTEEYNKHREAVIPPEPTIVTKPEKHPFEVEFFMFFPNNYTGMLDRPGQKDNNKYYHSGQTPVVDAIFYLLAGRSAQKNNQYDDEPLSMDMESPEAYLTNTSIGYEMSANGITDGDTNTYIMGGTNERPWKAVSDRVWGYRIDHIQEDNKKGGTKYRDNMDSTGVNLDPVIDNINTLNQGVYKNDLKDFGSGYSFNLEVGDYLKEHLGIDGNENVYSLAEVAMAMYSSKVLNYEPMYNYLNNKLSSVDGSIDRVNKLIEVFGDTDMELESVTCKGCSNQHGQTSRNNDYVDGSNKTTRRNKALAENRRDTILYWIKSNSRWTNVTNDSDDENSWTSDHIINNTGNKINSGINTPNAKIWRNAYCHMKFKVSDTYSTAQSEVDPSTVKSDYYQMIPFWKNNESYEVDTVVQKDGKAYRAYIRKVDCEITLAMAECTTPAVTDSTRWIEVTVKPYNKKSNYSQGEYILYKNYVYEVLQDIEGELHEHKDAEFKGYKGFTWVKDVPQSDGSVWHYYKKDTNSSYWEQNATDNSKSSEEDTHELKLTTQQVFNIFKKMPYYGIRSTVVEDNENYRGEYDEVASYPKNALQTDVFKWTKYVKSDIVKYNDVYYNPKFDFTCSERYYYFDWDATQWDLVGSNSIETTKNYFKGGYNVIDKSNRYEAEKNNMCYFEDTVDGVDGQYWHLCQSLLSIAEGKEKTDSPKVGSSHWNPIDDFSTTRNYEIGDLVVYGGHVYKAKEKITNSIYDSEDRRFHRNQWEKQSTTIYSPFKPIDYVAGDIVEDTLYYVCTDDIEGIEQQVWSTTIHEAIKNLVENDCNIIGYENDTTGISVEEYNKLKTDAEKSNYWPVCETGYDFYGNYPYRKGKDIIYKDNQYYTPNVDFSKYSKSDVKTHAWDANDWVKTSEEDLYNVKYTKDDYTLQQMAATILCWPEDEFREQIATQGSDYSPKPPVYHTTYLKDPNIFEYGTINDDFWNNVSTGTTDLADYISSAIGGSIVFSTNENNMLSLLIDNDNLEHDLTTTCNYIAMYRLLKGVTKLVDDKGNEYDPCTESVDDFEELTERTKKNASDADCDDTLWVDRGDGILIQECELKNGGVVSRFNVKTGEGDWNKLRYDQEYYFYRQYFADHPFVFDKLQDKIKYFQPAFHSTTPEGFNARLTFLQQCTRQGNTKTMSDLGGNTANNLAFGRAPYCVLRLGDFYYQMIVIDSISFDYSVSDGLQWDLNTEGNGVQPMLCNVNISFKFIGGGDITGPVRRLQNAMSFNYYANTSFYDNRADRVTYQHNVETMGGAGNNKVLEESSYAFNGKLYEGDERPITIVNANGAKSSETNNVK